MNSVPQNHTYTLRPGHGFWTIVFAGQASVFRHQHGAYYIAYLLLERPAEPIPALALALRTRARFEFKPQRVELMDPATGRPVLLDRDAVFQQRSLGLDEAAAARALWRTQQKLEALLEDPDTIEPVRSEAARELASVYRAQRTSRWRPRDAAYNCARAVRRAISRFRQGLRLAARNEAVLARFSAHLDDGLKFNARGGPRGLLPATCIFYDAPADVVWSE